MGIIRFNDEEVFTTDSSDYHVLQNACIAVKNIPGAVVEIGTRRGGSAKLMMDNLDPRVFFCIDPYGNIETQLTNFNINKFYKHLAQTEGDPDSKELSAGVRLDYNNEMRNRIIPSLYYYAYQRGFEFTFFALEDTEFFRLYESGVPVYNQEKYIIDEYALVFFDGPHTNEAVFTEARFFNSRSPIGAIWVFDDIWQYSHDELVEPEILTWGWALVEKTHIKASYKKVF